MEDREEPAAAYQAEAGLYPEGDTLYIAGTKSFGDVVDDITIPFGLTNMTQRYHDATLVLNKNPQITKIIGHSLGGAVALELQKQQPSIQTRTYGAPVFSTAGTSERFREVGDPVAMFDFGAITSRPTSFNPHSFGRIATHRDNSVFSSARQFR